MSYWGYPKRLAKGHRLVWAGHWQGNRCDIATHRLARVPGASGTRRVAAIYVGSRNASYLLSCCRVGPGLRRALGKPRSLSIAKCLCVFRAGGPRCA